ncbi:hypothetical protein [Novosphingobium sp. ST904]|uniref:hypothetical protein n=1 Tax=Novosphingobium sp. ST904 TaxID=1684385 RepID=UPI00104DA70A|nr:hypothetical protein [Novosphingobium sp. ST904]TCM30025.1 hypothetical protein EDF59_12752 [Novosphingobium sp. ST904]
MSITADDARRAYQAQKKARRMKRRGGYVPRPEDLKRGHATNRLEGNCTFRKVLRLAAEGKTIEQAAAAAEMRDAEAKREPKA